MNKETIMEVFDLPVSTMDLVLKYNLPVKEASIIKTLINEKANNEDEITLIRDEYDLLLDELEDVNCMGDVSKILRQYGRG